MKNLISWNAASVSLRFICIFKGIHADEGSSKCLRNAEDANFKMSYLRTSYNWFRCVHSGRHFIDKYSSLYDAPSAAGHYRY